MGRSSATQAHYATNITPLLSADSCSVLNTAILLPLPATADEQDCRVCPEQIPCQQTLKTNAGSAPQHRMEFVFILSPDLLEKIVCREAHKHLCRVNFHSARLALTWNRSTKYIQRILGRALWLRLATHPHCSSFQRDAFAWMQCQVYNGSLCLSGTWCRDAQANFQGQLVGQCNNAADMAALE